MGHELFQRSERLLRARLLLIVIGLIVFTAAILAGSMLPVNRQFAQETNQSVNAGVPRHNFWALTSLIFQHNFLIALLGFVPILIGAGLLIFVGYSTGVALSGLALLDSSTFPGITGPEELFLRMIQPFFFWELAGYAVTLMEGIIITRGLVKSNRFERFIAPGHFRDGELFKALLVLVLTAIVLFIAAAIESYLIVRFG